MVADAVPDGAEPQTLPRTFEELGLSPYEARVLLALLRAGSARSSHLARLAEVPRTSAYAVLESLADRRLVHRVPGDGPSVWATPGPDEVLARLEAALEAAQHERLREHRARTTDARRLLAATMPEPGAIALPYVHFVRGAANVKRAYEQLMADADEELVLFNRPPYSWDPGTVNPAVLDMLHRSVSTRVLYQAAQWDAPNAQDFRQHHAPYHDAGVQGRVTQRLPMKLAVADRRVALVCMDGPEGVGGSYPTTLLIEDPGFAIAQAWCFEFLWQDARPVGP